jgi:cyclopropane-fatty-acyl-phospholipid synthase
MKKKLPPQETAMEFAQYSIGQHTIPTTLCRSIFLNRLSKLHHGVVEIIEEGNSTWIGNRERDDLRARVKVQDPSFYPSIVFGGSIGAGESYMDSKWSCDNLTNLIRIIIKNRDVLLALDNGLARLSAPLYKLFHSRRENTTEGSQKNSSAHYDLGNDFFKLFLDETLAYSCGIYATDNATLQEASIEKFDRICKKLRLSPEDHLLEIGAGWGGFAIHAADKYGCKVTTTTISREQYALANERIKQAGLADRIDLICEDYRHITGQFDKLVSIEMIEAVGHHFFEKFFNCCSNLLKTEGLMLLQAITISDQVFEDHKRSVDFIKRYIFPGCCIPSTTAIIQAVTKASDMKLFHFEDITPHYVKTLRTWRQKFFSAIAAVREQGFDESFIKMWEFYLCYCEAGFAERYLGDSQMILTKPDCRHEPILPPLG